jgi:hypothetical protein
MIYDIRSNGKEHGSVFTRSEIVSYIINSVGLTRKNNISTKKILDPAVGEGAFIIPIIQIIINTFKNDDQKIKLCLNNITAYEIDNIKYDRLMQKLNKLFNDNNLNGFEKYLRIFNEDYLLASSDKFDLVIGNPPYVRYDKIPANKIDFYRNLFSCFKYRCDLYILFFEKGLKSLKENGILSFICSDRWLNNQYGRPLRLTIKNNFSFKEIIRLNNFNPFHETVTTYPAIFTIVNSESYNTHYYIANSIQSLTLNNIEKSSSIIKFNNDGELELSNISHAFSTIEEQGFKIGIGVASGADKVFIVKKENINIENDILIPILTRKDVNDKGIDWHSNYIINPFDRKTKNLINLDNYPLLADYLNKNKEVLSGRHISKRNQKNWYRTIDRIDLDILKRPKLLIPDISVKNIIYFDDGKYYPHHNFYYIIGNNLNDLLVLMAFLSTDYVKNQIKEKCTLMNGGALRRQAQTLRKIKIPNINLLTQEKKLEIINAYKYHKMEIVEIIINTIAA